MVDRVPNFQFVDPKTGYLTPAGIGFFQSFVANSGSISNVLSGVAIARAEALAAQIAADAAAQAAQDVAAEALPMSVALSIPSVYAERFGSGVLTTISITASVTGGTGPYTWAWTKVSGDTLDPVTPTSASTTFQKNMLNGQSLSAVYKATVTDSLTATAFASIGIAMVSVDQFEGGGLPP